ncbi:hypothetical protein A6V39_04625 [Candidatus Mycoplasma haematobovis]|uniref:Uncharacterized protein n=1 Tax=Candidatus Mycoplasma haematobovis TaxID=432608 RepID=A0A1A9QEP8_9MOLU|nr:hypothetical protein [Candidatus Mycoplasma haematobovis]OAL10169.1 hypothetical protein A6V39_04625 [Candidatus Mycoplasma haematobovis]
MAMEKKKKEGEKKVELKLTLDESVFDYFWSEFEIVSSLNPLKIAKFEKFDDFLTFYIKKLIYCCGNFFKLESCLMSIFLHLKKLGVPIQDFDDLIEKLDLIGRLSKKSGKRRKS